MIIYHNMKADNAHRMLGINQSGLGKNVEKLSSGLRVNRAADDAAGLFISEKMRSQVRGLNQASRNALDGISAVQTAEGALDEVHSMLQRMRELTVQAANDPNQMQDKRAILEEMQQLGSEIESISVKTEFNKQRLLDGSFEGKKLQVGANQNQTLEMSIESLSAVKLGLGEIAAEDIKHEAPVEKGGKKEDSGTPIEGAPSYTFTAGAKTKWEGGELKETDKVGKLTIDGIEIDFSDCNVANGADPAKIEVKATLEKIRDKINNDARLKDKLVASLKTGDKNLVLTAKKAGKEGINVEGIKHAATVTPGTDDKHDNTWKSTAEVKIDPATDEKYKGKAVVINVNGIDITVKKKDKDDALDKAAIVKALNDNEEFKKKYKAEIVDTDKLQITALDTSKMKEIKVSMKIGEEVSSSATEASIGKIAVKKGEFNLTLDISTNAKANEALGEIDEAISKVSTQRSALGAIQNRLEHTIKNLDNASENTQAAESRIRDIDMAKEMSTFTRNNILTQASQAMLAQANQLPQQVLQLLR